MNERVFERVNALSTELDGETVFYNADKGKYHATGAVGAEIWSLLESPRTLEEICIQLLDKFDVDFETCRTEVNAFLEDMIKSGLVK